MQKNVTERFWAKVDKTGDCWEWKAGCCPGGYGNFGLDGKTQRASRVAWKLTYGSIPGGLQVLHHCDNCACVNPNHLWLGTHADNQADKAKKGRSTYGEFHPQRKLTEASVLAIRELADSMKQIELARLFGISDAQVNRIIHRVHWARI